MTLKDTTIDEKDTIADTLESELALFTARTRSCQHCVGMLYTNGVYYLAERARAYWLLEAIASWQPDLRPIEKEFQLWELTVHADHSANLTAQLERGEPPIVDQKIEFTDFPLKSIKLYVQKDVLLLPSEYGTPEEE